MKMAISNIAWESANDEDVYLLMQKYGFTGLEIAPTRIFSRNPYDKLAGARTWSRELKRRYGFTIPSMQSIWYGRTECIFGTADERGALLEYTKKAVNFAEAVGCRNLVFGCPKNRLMLEGASRDSAVRFFREIGDYAFAHGTVIGMEANPSIYGTNFINTTKEAIELICEVNSKGFRLNLDTGTMIYNDEPASLLKGCENLIKHVHISEPGLKLVEKRPLHRELCDILSSANYRGFVSIEMGNAKDLAAIKDALEYVGQIFAAKDSAEN